MVKFGRNLLCPCGSGKKYKKCCLNQFITEDGSTSNSGQMLIPYAENNLFHEFSGRPLKMSEIMLEFAEEFLCNAESIEEKVFIISVACMAWNLALIEGSAERAYQMKKTIKKFKMNKSDALELKDFLSYFIDNKLEVYPDINKFIVDYYLNDSKQHLLVFS
jgi:hypothetical protein